MFLKNRLKSLAAISAAVINLDPSKTFNKKPVEDNSLKDEKVHKCENKNCHNYNINVKNERSSKLSEAIAKSRLLVEQFKMENGAPGIAVGVTIDGESVWEEGFGFSDIENGVQCKPETVMRIASISKPITMAVVAKLWEDGKIDLDKPIQHYVDTFPEKKFNGENVTVTGRHIVSHTSGIRHYNKSSNSKESNEYEEKEFFKKDKYLTVDDALKIFQDDELAFKPGTSFLYTTHGFTLLSAVVERVVKVPFAQYIETTFNNFGMHHTYLDVYEPLIYNRSRYYVKSKKGLIENAPYVDNSYKWAGGGLLSCVSDLTRFGNIMLYSYQQQDKPKNDKCQPGYLKRETVKELWTPSPQIDKQDDKATYGMGWFVGDYKHECKYCHEKKFVSLHSGGACGATSLLLIMPRKPEEYQNNEVSSAKGVVVAILINLQSAVLRNLGTKIANNFYDVGDIKKP